jgi:Nucleotidyl transferase AbiEii toxin, Type IV TA system
MHTEALTKAGLELFPALTAFDDFYLAGGTALALQIGHRLSVDFDLFCDGPIRPNASLNGDESLSLASGEAGHQ